jgi:hypothetical protein
MERATRSVTVEDIGRRERLARWVDGLCYVRKWLVLGVIILLPVMKILATSLSIGSGGSGGIFGPGMVIGGFVGAAMWRVLEPIAPQVPHSPAPFVIVAMMACFGSIGHVPSAVMLMVAEMTGNLALLAPAMVAVGVASFLVGDRHIYRAQLHTRADAPGHRFRFGLTPLSAVPVANVMTAPRLLVRRGESAKRPASASLSLACRALQSSTSAACTSARCGTMPCRVTM